MKNKSHIISCAYWSIVTGLIVGLGGMALLITMQRNPLPLNGLHYGLALSGFIIGSSLGANGYAQRNATIESYMARIIGRIVGLSPLLLLIGVFVVTQYAEWLKGA